MKGDGKDICKELKKIRQQIASDNNIPLEDNECHYEGPCNGTCPRCDVEIQYLENEIEQRRGKLGKAAIVAGMTLSLAASCATEGDVVPLEGDVIWPEDTTEIQNDTTSSPDKEANLPL